MENNKSATQLDRMLLEKEFGGYVPAPSPSAIPNIPFQGVPSLSLEGTSPENKMSLEDEIFSRRTKSDEGLLTGGSIPRSLSEVQNPRFPIFVPGDYNNEDAYAQGQHWTSKMVNAVGKGIGLIGTTFISSTAGLIYGGIKWAADGKFSSFYNNELTRGLDEFNKHLENITLPNYYTDVEREAPWYSPNKLLTANFLFDGIIKNLGFAVGAALSGGVYAKGIQALTKGLGMLPGVGKLLSAGKAAEAIEAVEAGMTEATATGKIAKIAGGLKRANEQFLGTYKVLNPAQRAIVAGLATTGEASIESLQNLNQYRDELIQNYKDEHLGEEPTGEILERINKEAEGVGNNSFLLNVGLLSATNYIQFPKILGSSYAAEKGIINDVVKKTGKIVEKEGEFVAKKSTKGVLGILNKIRPYTFSTSEAFEEGSQYAITVGTQDYYEKKFNGERTSVAESLVEGIKAVYGTDEGMQNVLIGGLSGALMLARGKYKEAKEKGISTQAAVSEFNKRKLSDFTRETFDSVSRGVQIQKEREEALADGRITDSKDLEQDYIINYVTPRIKYGRYDLVKADIETYRELASTEEGFEQLKQEGKALPSDTREAYLNRLNQFSQTAENVKTMYQSLNLRYGGILNKEGKAKYSPIVIDKMIYAASKIADYDKRISNLSSKLISAGIDINKVTEGVINGEYTEYKNAVSTIRNLNLPLEEDDLLQGIDDISVMSWRRNKFIKEYTDIKNHPEEFEDVPVDITEISDEDLPIVKVGGREVSLGKEYSIENFMTREGNSLIMAPKVNILSQTVGGEFKVKLPNGKVKFLNEKEVEDLKLTDVDNKSRELSDIMDSVIDEVLSQEKYKDIQKAPATGKLAYINSLGNKSLIDDVENLFNSKIKDVIIKREKERKRRENLIKQQEIIEKQLNNIELNSGTPVDPPVEGDYEGIKTEGKLKSANILFTSTTTESEDYEDAESSDPHIKRARTFLNNAKNFSNRNNLRSILITPSQVDDLKLKGIVQLSYGKNVDDDINTIPNVKDVNSGWVASIFVEQEGSKLYFIDEKGERIGEVWQSVDINKVVFQTMPTISLLNSKDKPRYRETQKEEAEAQSKAWAIKRAELFVSPSNKLSVYEFKISRGIPNEIVTYEEGKKVRERNQISGTLIPEGKEGEKIIRNEEGLLKVSTTGTVYHNGENIPLKNGLAVISYGDTLQIISPNRLGVNKARGIYAVIKALSKELEDKGTVNAAYAKYLQNVLYWRKESAVKDNQIYIDIKNVTINIGSHKYAITEIESKEDEIVNILKDAFHNINNSTLTKEFNKKFVEYGEDLKPIEWKNYQTYLLSGENRTPNETPIVTSVAKPTELKPNSFKQKYAILLGLELPIVKKEPVKVTPEQTEGEKKTMKFGKGDIEYSSKVVDGELQIEVTNNDTVKEYAKDIKTLTEQILPAIKSFYTYEEGKEEEAVMTFFAYKIKATLEKEQYKEPEKPVEKTSSLEERKADIERRRQSEIFNTLGRVDMLSLINDLLNSEITESIASEIFKRLQGKTGKIRFKEGYIEVNFGSHPNTIIVIGKDKEGDDVRISYSPNSAFKSGVLLESTTNSENIKDYGKLKNPFLLEEQDIVTQGEERKIYNQIKIKYADELKQLVEKEFPFSKEYNKENIKPPSSKPKYRKTVKGERKDILTDAEITFFKEWANKNVPGIPFEVLENIVNTNDGETAWGVFENGVAKFYRRAIKGTEYHEVFHGIWNSFLSPGEREAILSEEKAKEGYFTDRESGKKVHYSEATDNQIIEKLADEFGDFISGRIPAKSLGQRIVEFFRNIINFIKSFVMKPSAKKELFEAINKGKFKEYKVKDTYQAPLYKKVENLSERVSYQYVDDMTIRASQIIFGQDKMALFDFQRLTGEFIFGKIKEMYIEENKYQELGEKAWKGLVKRTKDKLRTIGISFHEDDRIDINDAENNNRDYAPEPFTTDWKKSSPFAIKVAIATLPVTEPTNQQESSTLELPDAKISDEAKGYVSMNFSQAFSTLLHRLSNNTPINDLEKKLVELIKSDSNYVRLFTRLGGDLSTGTFNFSKFGYEEWRLFINFFQTFTRQKPNMLVQYTTGTESYVGGADLYIAAEQLKKRWIEELKRLSTDPTSLISWDGYTKTYNFKKPKDYTAPRNIEESIQFLNSIGIGFTKEMFVKLKGEKGKRGGRSERERFFTSVSAIHRYLQEAKDIVTISDKVLKVRGPIATINELIVKVTNPNQDNTHYNLEGNKIQNFADNNVISIFENEFNSVSNVDKLKENRPELNDVFSKNSVILKKGGEFYDEDGNQIKEFKVGVIEGEKNNITDKGVTIPNLTIGKRFAVEINQNINGNYYVLVPADATTEWSLNMGNHISYEEISNEGTKWATTLDIFRGYLNDDIALALDYENRQELKNIGKEKAKELRVFKEILNETTLSDINTLMKEDAPLEDINTYIDENIDKINNDIISFITTTVENTKKNLITSGQIDVISEKDTFKYSFSSIDDNFTMEKSLNKLSLTEDQINNILTFVNTNYTINNIEFHKILFGDPYQFAIKNNNLDETKRIKSFLSPRRVMFDTPEFNSWLNKEYNQIDGIDLEEGELGNYEFKSFTSTVTASDIHLSTDVYEDTNETDAMSYILDNTYKEVKIKNGQWLPEAEKWHQWQMAYTRQNLPGYVYKSERLKEHDINLIKTEEPKYVTEVLKPIVTGNKFGENKINLVMDKFSQMPLYYKAVKGTSLGKLYEKMWKEKIGYVVMESGRKVGATSLYSLYNEDKGSDLYGTLNTLPFSGIIDVPWKAYGIQVETAHDKPTEQTYGSQLGKICSLDLFDNGEPIGENEERKGVIRNAYSRNIKTLNNLHSNGYRRILKKLGIEDLGDKYELVDAKAVQDTLEHEMLRRELSENAKDTLQTDENGKFIIPFEASPSYQQIKNIIYSIINKNLVSPKMHGGPKVQTPATMWEDENKGRDLVIKDGDRYKKITRKQYNTLSDEEKLKVRFTSNKLAFYTKEKPYCEIMLPNWMREKFSKKIHPTDESILTYLNNTKEGRKILSGIGFRIPTQAMASIEVFKVAGFLPAFMGDTVVVPSEITTKAGSDFDIDKLNMYLKSVYKDEYGDVKLIEYKGSEEKTREFYAGVYDRRMKNNIERIQDDVAFKEMLYSVLDKMETLPDAKMKSVKDIFSFSLEEWEFYNDNIEIINEIVDQSDDEGVAPSEYVYSQVEKANKEEQKLIAKSLNNILREKYVDDMYHRSLENEYYESLEELIKLPENFERLLSPIGNAGLKEMSEHLNKLRGKDESLIKGRLYDRNYMTTLRHSFVSAKRWVGRAAVNITGQSLTQKGKIYIDPKKIEALSKFEKNILGDGRISIPHNTTEVDGINYISISGIKTADKKEYISDRLSGYITSFVDVAKDPYIMDIIEHDSVVSSFLFLERIGAGKIGIKFMAQPIISEYLSYISSRGTSGLFNMKNIEFIKNKFGGDTVKTKEFDYKTFDSNIEKYYSGEKFTDEQNGEQQAIFNEFLKIAKMAEYSFKLSQASNYDTTKFRSGDSFHRKLTRTEIAEEKNIFSSVSEILDNSQIGFQSDLLGKAINSTGAIMKLESRDFRAITDPVMRAYEEHEFIKGDTFDTIANKLRSSFLDYIIQTKGKDKLNKRIRELLIDPKTSVATQLTEAKKRHPEIAILNHLFTDSSRRGNNETSTKTVKADVNPKNVAYDEDIYTDMMRELKDVEPELYDNLINLSILQGTYQSSVSIKNIIPVEDYSAKIKPIIDSLVPDVEVSNFAKGWFQRNNWKDETIVPSVNLKFFPASYYDPSTGTRIEEQPEVDEWGNLIYRYDIPAYENPKLLKAIKTSSSHRKILFLSEKYNANEIKYDFVKVPRLLTDRDTGQKMDVMTGEDVTNSMIREKLAKGDWSYYNVYGYQKVKFSNDEPVVTAKGEHIYKLVNLYGDGQYGSEYYDTFLPSVMNNGTMKVKQEIEDTKIIGYYGDRVQESPVETKENTPEGLPSIPRTYKSC